jgi:hypothetical protein
MKVGSAHPWGLDIFSIQDKRVSIAVGIIIVVGVGIGIGIDPDTDSDPDTDGNQKQTDRQQPGSGGRCPPDPFQLLISVAVVFLISRRVQRSTTQRNAHASTSDPIAG